MTSTKNKEYEEVCIEWLKNQSFDPIIKKRIVYGMSKWKWWYNKSIEIFGEDIKKKIIKQKVNKHKQTCRKPQNTHNLQSIKREESSFYLDNFPEEILLYIVSLLDSKSWGRIRKTSKIFNRIASEPSLISYHDEMRLLTIHPWLRYTQKHIEDYKRFVEMYIGDTFKRKEEINFHRRQLERVSESERNLEKRIKNYFTIFERNHGFENKMLVSSLLFLYDNQLRKGFEYILKPEEFDYEDLIKIFAIYIQTIWQSYEYSLPLENKIRRIFPYILSRYMKMDERVKLLKEMYPEKKDIATIIENMLVVEGNLFRFDILSEFFNGILNVYSLKIVSDKCLRKFAFWYGVDENKRNIREEIRLKQNIFFEELDKKFYNVTIDRTKFRIFGKIINKKQLYDLKIDDM